MAHKDLRGEQEIVLIAVEKDGMALQFASDELKKDSVVVDAAIAQNPKAKKFAWKENEDGFGEKPVGTSMDGTNPLNKVGSRKKGLAMKTSIDAHPLHATFNSQEASDDPADAKAAKRAAKEEAVKKKNDERKKAEAAKQKDADTKAQKEEAKRQKEVKKQQKAGAAKKKKEQEALLKDAKEQHKKEKAQVS